MHKQLKFYLQRNPAVRALECWIFNEPLSPNEKRSIVEPIIYRDLTEEDQAVMLDPSFYLDEIGAQSLMDELWKEGIRPSDIGTAGHLEAVKYHLEDMRKLVFNK